MTEVGDAKKEENGGMIKNSNPWECAPVGSTWVLYNRNDYGGVLRSCVGAAGATLAAGATCSGGLTDREDHRLMSRYLGEVGVDKRA